MATIHQDGQVPLLECFLKLTILRTWLEARRPTLTGCIIAVALRNASIIAIATCQINLVLLFDLLNISESHRTNHTHLALILSDRLLLLDRLLNTLKEPDFIAFFIHGLILLHTQLILIDYNTSLLLPPIIVTTTAVTTAAILTVGLNLEGEALGVLLLPLDSRLVACVKAA